MAYMLLILEPPGQRQQRSDDEGRALYQRMLDFGDRLKARGLLTSGQALRSDSDGVRVRLRQGKRALVDGPFSESKEMIGGFFLLECASKAEAIEIASECPAAEWATVEVRELGPCFM